MSVAEQERQAAEARRHAQGVGRRVAEEQAQARRKADSISRKIQRRRRSQEDRANAAVERGRRVVRRIEGR